MERLYFLVKIEKGLEQAEAGQTMSHEEAKGGILGSRSFVGPTRPSRTSGRSGS